jgi:hypothetical protein
MSGLRVSQNTAEEQVCGFVRVLKNRVVDCWGVLPGRGPVVTSHIGAVFAVVATNVHPLSTAIAVVVAITDITVLGDWRMISSEDSTNLFS